MGGFRAQPCRLAKLAIVECEQPCFWPSARRDMSPAR